MKTGLFDCFSTTHCTLHIPPAYTSAMKIQMLILTTGDDRINLANPETAQALSDSDAQRRDICASQCIKNPNQNDPIHPNASEQASMHPVQHSHQCLPRKELQFVTIHSNKCIQIQVPTHHSGRITDKQEQQQC